MGDGDKGAQVVPMHAHLWCCGINDDGDYDDDDDEDGDGDQEVEEEEGGGGGGSVRR